MSSNFGLPSLPSLGAFVPTSGSSSADTPHSDGPSLSTSLGKAALNVMTGGLSGAVDAATGGTGEGLSIQRVVIVILGLLLIAAGIFAFKPVRETVIESAKTGAKAAAMA